MEYVSDGIPGESVGPYANCRGSRVLGTDEQMWALTSFSKHFINTKVSAIGRKSLWHAAFAFLGYEGDEGDLLKHVGTMDCASDTLNMAVKTGASRSAQTLRTCSIIPSGLAAFLVFTCLNFHLTSCSERTSSRPSPSQVQ